VFNPGAFPLRDLSADEIVQPCQANACPALVIIAVVIADVSEEIAVVKDTDPRELWHNFNLSVSDLAASAKNVFNW
jgi:hypothetical protein